MFLSIDDKLYNVLYAQELRKEEKDGKYLIIYTWVNGYELTEEFDTEVARDTKYNEVLGAGIGGGGTSDYADLDNKPKINSVTLSGNKSAHDLGLASTEDISTVYSYKGTVSTYSNLPSSGNKTGDVYNIEKADSTHGIKAGDNVAWDGSDWDKLGGDIDLSSKQDVIQYSTMPTASASTVGKIVQYIGTTDSNYKNGYFYIGITDGGVTPTYSWQYLNVNKDSISVIDTDIKVTGSSAHPIPAGVYIVKRGTKIIFSVSNNTDYFMPSEDALMWLSYHAYQIVIISSEASYNLSNPVSSGSYSSELQIFTGYYSGGFTLSRWSLKPFNANYVTADENNTISGLLTFSKLPESSITPTTANQFTNKAYVDSKAGGGGGVPLRLPSTSNSNPFDLTTAKPGFYYVKPALYDSAVFVKMDNNNNNDVRMFSRAMEIRVFKEYSDWQDGDVVAEVRSGGSSNPAKASDSVTVHPLIANSNKSINANLMYFESSPDQLIKTKDECVASNIAPLFSTTSTYAVGDYVIHYDYGYKLYKCITAVTVAGSWNSSNWTQTTVGEMVSSTSFDPTIITGYNASKTQILKHVNGTLTWVDDYVNGDNLSY